jgi:hypothetical protein
MEKHPILRTRTSCKELVSDNPKNITIKWLITALVIAEVLVMGYVTYIGIAQQPLICRNKVFILSGMQRDLQILYLDW